MDVTESDGRELKRLVCAGAIRPEDYPGKPNEAFRLLIRSIRVAHQYG